MTATEPLSRIERPRQAPSFLPPAPERLEDLGLSVEFVNDLLLRTLHVQGARGGLELSEITRISFPIIDDLLLSLQHRRLIEVRGAATSFRSGYVFDLTSAGRVRAREALDSTQYVGPAPVPLAQYRAAVAAQSITRARITPDSIHEGFEWLVLDHGTLELLGPAISSGRSIFLHGDSGNGKTAIAETISGLFGGSQLVPYAVEVAGEILVLHDPVHHAPVPPDAGEPDQYNGLWTGAREEHDARYTWVRRPVVMTGGELTLNQLDLQYDFQTKLYQAPFQLKANGGVLIIDDFGRQRVPPRDLLNRWIVPLEKRVDFLTLHTGSKFPVPFDCLLIFATNIPPSELVEEAFLRRIHYKIRVESPTLQQYELIFRRYCETSQITYKSEAVGQVYRDFYRPLKISPRGCHPRDIIDHLCDIARYLQTVPELSPEMVDRACRSYFLDFPTDPFPSAAGAQP